MRWRLARVIRRGIVVALVALTGVVMPNRLLAQVACGTPGKDGPGGVLTGVVNTYFPSPAASTVAAGATSLTLGAGVGTVSVTAGDLLLVIQMQDAAINATNGANYGANAGTRQGVTALNNSGLYEYVVATGPLGLVGGTVGIRGGGAGGGLLNSYGSAAATGTRGKRAYQVIRVPQYRVATFSSGLTAAPWNGATGGVLAVDVAGQLTLGGTVSVDGLGFRGGAGRTLAGGAGGTNTASRSPATDPFHAAKGEGIAGTGRYLFFNNALVDTGIDGYPNGSSARGAPGNAGGGGNDGNPTNNDENSGGGGGANGGRGGGGGNTWNSNVAIGGVGGLAIPYGAGVGRLGLGGGGGAGTSNNATGVPGAGLRSSGAAGGGVVLLRAGAITGVGGISANGAAPNNTTGNDGSGGGGAGGSVVVVVATGTLAGLTISANGGDGASNTGGGAPHGPGGGGGGGFVAMNAGGASVSVQGGVAGTTTGVVPATYGATNGSAGVVLTTILATAIPGSRRGARCVPVLTVSKTTSTSAVSIGGNAVYTIVVSNAANRAPATAVDIADALPAGFTYASNLAPVLAGGATRTTVVNPAVGAVAPVLAQFTIPGGGSVTVTLTAAVSVSAAPGVRDNDVTATYVSPVRTTVSGTVVVSFLGTSSTAENVTVLVPNLRVSKAVVGGLEVGVNGVYTLTPENTGGAATFGAITLTDTLPATLTFISAAGTGWTCAHAASVVTCGRAAVIAPAASGAVVTLTVAVTAAAAPSVTNIAAIVGGGEQVATLADNRVAVTTVVGRREVAVRPDGGTVGRVPRNGVQYTTLFVVTNSGTLSDRYTLGVSVGAGAVVTVISTNGTPGLTGTVTLAAGATASIPVVYTVAGVAAGQSQTLQLTATSSVRPAITDPGLTTVTVIRPALTMTKQLYRRNQTTLLGPADTAVPGETLWYRLAVTNGGSADAITPVVVDPLPAGLTYVSTNPDVPAAWSVTVAGNTVTASLTAPLAVGVTRVLWIRVVVP